MKAFKFDGSVLVVSTQNSDNELRAIRNVEGFEATTAELLSVYDVVASRNVVLTESAVKYLEEANA